MKRVAVVTGANRGIGLEITRQLAQAGLHVILASRDFELGRASASLLQRQDVDVETAELDVTSEPQIEALAVAIERAHGGLDVLVNNAAVALTGFDAAIARVTIDVNFFGPLRVTDRLLPLLRPEGRVVMMTSGLGDSAALGAQLRARFQAPDLGRDELVSLMRAFVTAVDAGVHSASGWPSSAYAVSKIGVNALTGIYGRDPALIERGILCNAACPGWVRTRMGGRGAPRAVDEGAETPVWLALLPQGGPQGGVFRDKAPTTW